MGHTYDIGTFFVSDNKCKVKVVGTVEKDNSIVKPQFWIYFDSKSTDDSISFALSSIELRCICYALKVPYTQSMSNYKKMTGGQVTTKTLEVEIKQNNKSTLKAFHKGVELFYNFTTYECLSFADEVLHLIEACSNSAYLLQQVISKKKRQKLEGEK